MTLAAGPGYARVPRAERAAWRPLLVRYLAGRTVIRAGFVLIDARSGAECEELDLIGYLGELAIPAQVILTKADKLPNARHASRRIESVSL